MHCTMTERATCVLPPSCFHCCLLHECKIYNIVSLKGITTLHSKWVDEQWIFRWAQPQTTKHAFSSFHSASQIRREGALNQALLKYHTQKWPTSIGTQLNTLPPHQALTNFTFRTSLKFFGRGPRSLKNKHNFYIIRANQQLATNLKQCYKLATNPSAHKDGEKFIRVQHHGVELNAEVS